MSFLDKRSIHDKQPEQWVCAQNFTGEGFPTVFCLGFLKGFDGTGEIRLLILWSLERIHKLTKSCMTSAICARTGSSKLISHWNIPLTRYTCSQSNIVCSMGLRGQSGWKSIPSGLKFIPKDCSRVSKAFFVRSGFSDDNIKAAAANSASVRSFSCPMSKHVWGTKVPLGSDRWSSLRACTTFQQNRQGRVPAAPLTAHIAFKAASSPMRHRRRPNKKTLRPLWSVRRSPDSRGVNSWVMTFVKQLTPPCSLPTLLLRTIDTVCHKSSLVKPRWPCWISDQ